jgi:hypothetical protein
MKEMIDRLLSGVFKTLSMLLESLFFKLSTLWVFMGFIPFIHKIRKSCQYLCVTSEKMKLILTMWTIAKRKMKMSSMMVITTLPVVVEVFHDTF